jgi:acyl-CoA reductase-like NAD-dependent aldehyde dehydrogenase
VPGRTHPRQVIRTCVRVVGHHEGTRAQPVFDESKDVRVEVLGAVEKQEVDRLRQVRFQRLCDEAAMRVALNDAAPLYRDAPEAQEARASGERTMQVFMREALPTAAEATRALAGELITTTLSTVGKRFSETPRAAAEIDTYADGFRYVLRLPRRPGTQQSRPSAT